MVLRESRWAVGERGEVGGSNGVSRGLCVDSRLVDSRSSRCRGGDSAGEVGGERGMG